MTSSTQIWVKKVQIGISSCTSNDRMMKIKSKRHFEMGYSFMEPLYQSFKVLAERGDAIIFFVTSSLIIFQSVANFLCNFSLSRNTNSLHRTKFSIYHYEIKQGLIYDVIFQSWIKKGPKLVLHLVLLFWPDFSNNDVRTRIKISKFLKPVIRSQYICLKVSINSYFDPFIIICAWCTN